METSRRKFIVGMSGGVDSSVAAALLVRAGHDVTGAFMKNWSDTKDPVTGICEWRKERDDAAAVAVKLGIPFVTMDFEKEYRDQVIGYMVREYAAGRTPNPDVMCNKEVKFDLFLAKALEMGADVVATGHYARVTGGPGSRELLAAADGNKDQTYFLHRLTQSQLANVEFPIGDMTKPEVRALASELGLATASKKDSVGICFVGEVSISDFLRSRIPEEPGDIVRVSDGAVVGRHDGAAPFTIGQRHGLGIGGGDPLFVVGKDMTKNIVYVAQGEDPKELYASSLIATDMHWVSGIAPSFPLTCKVRIRYRQPLQDAVVHAPDAAGTYRIEFASPQRAVSPGQFAVIYLDDVCLGGGVIDRAG
jgi:tRNA-specific 2-thiouridylase